MGGEHQRKLLMGRRARVDGLLRQRLRHGRNDPALPPLEVGRGLHRRRRQRGEPRLLRRQDVHVQRRRNLQAGARLLQLGRQTGPGVDAPELRRRAQREARRRVDRRQQLQLRVDRAGLRRRLAVLALVVARLLQRRLVGDEQLHVLQRHQGQGRNHDRDQKRRAGDDERGLQLLAVHDRRAGLPVADPARLGLPLRPERLHEADGRRMRVLERRRQLRQRKNAADDRRRRVRRGRGGRA